MLANCFSCDKPISEKARFCGKCGTNVRCKNCNEDLQKGDMMCEACGQEVVVRQDQNIAVVLNHIKYEDAKKGISLDARITDNFGANAAAVVGMLRGGQMPAPIRLSNRSPKAIPGQEELFDPAEVVNDEPNKTPATLGPLAPSNPPEETANTGKPLHSLFEQRDEEWVLVNPFLKAKSKADFVKRATCLFLQFQHDNGIKAVPRAEVIKLLQNCSAYDTNARDWFAKEKALLRATPNDLSLLLPGNQYVNKVMQEVLDDAIVNSWEVGTVRKTGRKPSAKKDRPGQSTNQADTE
ncbi:MAG: zinc ribbon domain-containing protein [Hymenobacter sp.]|nr:MAG: zinc ribbon domain-containing protein [Hymenobacter sp.]